MRECVSTCAIAYEISPTISGRSPRTRRIGRANETKGSCGTYSEGYSLDGADRVAAIARIAGAAQYLMTIHGIACVAHTRETLDHRPAARSAVPSFRGCDEPVFGADVDVDVRASHGLRPRRAGRLHEPPKDASRASDRRDTVIGLPRRGHL